jgi:hypothetical protein
LFTQLQYHKFIITITDCLREIFVSQQVTINESWGQDEEIVDTIFASDIRAEWVPWKHQTHQVKA